MSPPPLAATMITLPTAPRPEAADLYHHFAAKSPIMTEHRQPQCVILRERDEPMTGPSPAKRPAFNWDMEPRPRAVSASSSSNNSENSEDALNLTTRSRSSSDDADEDFHMTHQMPHKLRYKYAGHVSPVGSSIKSEEDY